MWLILSPSSICSAKYVQTLGYVPKVVYGISPAEGLDPRQMNGAIFILVRTYANLGRANFQWSSLKMCKLAWMRDKENTAKFPPGSTISRKTTWKMNGEGIAGIWKER
jgi:hypothetical protein